MNLKNVKIYVGDRSDKEKRAILDEFVNQGFTYWGNVYIVGANVYHTSKKYIYVSDTMDVTGTDITDQWFGPTLSEEFVAELNARIEDIKNPVRYYIKTDIFPSYYDVESGCYANNIALGTGFKSLADASSIATHLQGVTIIEHIPLSVRADLLEMITKLKTYIGDNI